MILVCESSEPQRLGLESFQFGSIQFEIAAQPPDTGFYLYFDESSHQLRLCRADTRDKGLMVDFKDAFQSYRTQKLSPAKDLLSRALGFDDSKKICDLTMGLAQDTAKLLYLGFTVTGVERDPIVAALVKNAMDRAIDEPAISRLSLHWGDQKDFLKRPEATLFDAYYLDPMFHHKRSALPKKDMQYLAEIVDESDDEDYRQVIETLQGWKKRLVIKRARQAKPLCEIKPRHSLEGKMIRFDVY